MRGLVGLIRLHLVICCEARLKRQKDKKPEREKRESDAKIAQKKIELFASFAFKYCKSGL
jgi:hypothetical protein